MNLTLSVCPNEGNSKVGYTFAAVPEAMLGIIDHPTAERLFQVLYSCIRRGWANPPVRWLAAQVDRSQRQVLRALKILEKGFIRIIRSKVSPTRNAPNRYQIIWADDADGDTDVTEKHTEKDVKTKAPRPAAPASENLLKAQIRRLAEQVQFYKNYLRRGQQIIQGQQWRKKKDLEAVRMGVQARVGSVEQWTEEELEKIDRYWEEKKNR